LIGAALTWSVLRWGRRPRPALGVAGVLAWSALGLGAVSPILHDTAWTGLSQRLLWLTLLAWLLLTAWQLDVHPAARAPALSRWPASRVPSDRFGQSNVTKGERS
jgi:hypothetical protein